MSASKPSLSKNSIGMLVIALAGPLIWALHFAVVYGIQHIVCTAFAGGNSGFWVQVTVIAATVIALPVLVLLVVKPEIVLRIRRYAVIAQDARSFLIGVMQLLALLSCFGVLWVGSSTLFLAGCGSLA